MLNQDQMTVVETVVGELIKMHRTFTGQDVYNRINNKKIRHEIPLPQVTLAQDDVSKYVRYLFNTKHIVFYRYGTTIIPHKYGPVMYFPIPYHAKKAVERIAAAVDAATTQLPPPPYIQQGPLPTASFSMSSQDDD